MATSSRRAQSHRTPTVNAVEVERWALVLTVNLAMPAKTTFEPSAAIESTALV